MGMVRPMLASIATPYSVAMSDAAKQGRGLMTKNLNRDGFLVIYNRALANAGELLEESELLFEAGKFARAYALAFTALEEISKSQLAADIYTGHITERYFHKHFMNHRKKIGRMAWATDDAIRYLDTPEGNYVEVEEPKVHHRMAALYVDLDHGRVVVPSDLITRAEAKGITHTVKSAFEAIFDI